MRQLLLPILVAFTLSVEAQITLNGQTTQGSTAEPLAGVHVVVNDSVALAVTDASGKFSIGLPDSVALVKFGHLGYRTVSLTLTEVPAFLSVPMTPGVHFAGEAVVECYAAPRQWHSSGASIHILRAEEVDRNHGASLTPILNTVPGVRMDERGPGGSRRLSIRGSHLRSPFGVRNLKVYWGDMPLTNADGSTPLEVMDPSMVGGVEVIKGPAGSAYGAGTGGVVRFHPRLADPGRNTEEIGFTFGDLGYERGTATYSVGNPRFNSRFNAFFNNVDGYRSQEFAEHRGVAFVSQVNPNYKSTTTAMGYYYFGEWGLPGALTQQEVEDDPTQAIPFSEDVNASVTKTMARMGLTHRRRLGAKWTSTTTIFGHTLDKENPYGTSLLYNGHKYENGKGYGLRSVLVVTPEPATRFSAGVEFQSDRLTLSEFTNTNSVLDAMTRRENTVTTAYHLFIQADLDLTESMQMSIGASFGANSIDHTDLFHDDGVNYSGIYEFTPVASPRIALVRKIADRLAARASIAYGYSPPTLWEYVLSDGTVNDGLEPERGITQEIGLKGETDGGKFRFDIVLFASQIRDAILPNPLPNTIVAFENKGLTRQNGIETWLETILTSSRTRSLKELTLRGGYTFHNFTYVEYFKNLVDFSGRAIPGVPRNSATLGVDLYLRNGVFLNVTGAYNDRIPLDDNNSTYADAHTILDAKLGVVLTRYRFFAGSRNLLDQQYNSYASLNAAGGRFYNPAPGRWFYFGFAILSERSTKRR